MADIGPISRTVIPAAPGTLLLSFDRNYPDEPVRIPVIAWLVTLTPLSKPPGSVMHKAEAITADVGFSPGEWHPRTILFPTGHVMIQDDASYDTEAAWLAKQKEEAAVSQKESADPQG
ncbi:hypothetical protein [Mesorhizobium sp.]|uniref:hypothetical protein n=1 Tax=Mesorhizobium sp. TaxID=1871066 RepID=UPI000FE9518D|nr:hypothetical protein [Mesorhizobium sp.]RWF64844.1 MAG: hypothetical protein EOS47_12990 [Mesorhizobium sp.]